MVLPPTSSGISACRNRNSATLSPTLGLPASITAPFSYTVVTADNGCGAGCQNFVQLGGPSGGLYDTFYNLFPNTLTETVASGVPEPSTWAMMLLGFAGVGFMACRRKSKPVLVAA
jgi:hypothetical protein